MKLRFVLGLLGLTLAACGGEESAEPIRVGDLEIRTELAPEAPRVGKNQLEIVLRDAEGRAVEGAELGVKVHMHAMGAMPAMGGPAATTELGGGRYRADFELAMGGTWIVELAATEPLFRDPRHPYTKALLSAVPNPDPDRPMDFSLGGEVADPGRLPPGCAFHPRCRECFGPCREQTPALRELPGDRFAACHLCDERT